MRIKKIKNEIHRIAKIEDAKETQEEVRGLDEKLQKEPIQKFPSGNYYYFRIVSYEYNPGPYGKRNIPGEKLGRISKKDYGVNKDIIDKLMREKNSKELKKFLEQY